MLAEEIQRLHQLHLNGALTEAEFAHAKAQLLSNLPRTPSNAAASLSAGSALAELNAFRRSRSDRWIGGICGSLGARTGLAAWIWRLVFFVFAMYFGIGVVLYILACIFVPEESATQPIEMNSIP
ncbi:MAG: PspC domain-containing protein [Pseudomonadota bacterium]|nr:PspC domain-containing protein [Pseudomonadota bacterium]